MILKELIRTKGIRVSLLYNSVENWLHFVKERKNDVEKCRLVERFVKQIEIEKMNLR